MAKCVAGQPPIACWLKCYRPQRPGFALPGRQLTASPRRQRQQQLVWAAVPQEVEPVPSVGLDPWESEEQLQQDAQWAADMVRLWLDEEWAPLPVHAELGQAAGQSYAQLQREGAEDMGDLVLGLATSLLAFDFSDTFVNAFEVSNKLVELLMLRQGCEVCCTSEEDRGALQRYAARLQEEREGRGP